MRRPLLGFLLNCVVLNKKIDNYAANIVTPNIRKYTNIPVAGERYVGAKKNPRGDVLILTPNIFVRKSFSLRRTVRPYGLKKEKYIRPSLQNNFLSLGSISYYSFPRRSLPPPAPSSGKKPLDRTSGVGKFKFQGRDGNSYSFHSLFCDSHCYAEVVS